MTDDAAESNAQKGLLERLGLGHVFANEPQNVEDIITLLRSANTRELIAQDALSMIEGVLKIQDMRVRDVMVPRSQMVCVDYDSSFDELFKVIIESGHSRFPVVRENRDEVVGVLLAKDLLRYFANGNQQQSRFHIEDFMREIVSTPETKSLNVLLFEFRNYRNHIAIVADEYGGTAGIVTLEDLLELIVGEIEDEHDEDDEDEPNISTSGEDVYIVRATTPIDEFNEAFNMKLSDSEFDTVGGLVMQKLGRVPAKGEVAELGQYRCEVVLSDARRLHLLRVTPL